MHSVVGTQIEEGTLNEGDPQKNNYWAVKLIMPPYKSRLIYFKTMKLQQKWMWEMRTRAYNSDIKQFYKFDNVLGQGQFGEVSRGVQLSTGKSVAIKAIQKGSLKVQ
jgi:serine/threonine protein kinase